MTNGTVYLVIILIVVVAILCIVSVRGGTLCFQSKEGLTTLGSPTMRCPNKTTLVVSGQNYLGGGGGGPNAPMEFYVGTPGTAGLIPITPSQYMTNPGIMWATYTFCSLPDNSDLFVYSPVPSPPVISQTDGYSKVPLRLQRIPHSASDGAMWLIMDLAK